MNDLNPKLDSNLNETCDPNPVLELYRAILYEDLLKKFNNDCISLLDKNIFNQKKNYIRTLTNLLSSWLFTLYSFQKKEDDIFFPSDYDHFDMIKETLLNFSKFDTKILHKESKISKILKNLGDNYLNLITKLEDYKKSDEFNKVKHDYKINFDEIILDRKEDLEKEKFKSFKIDHKFKIESTRLQNILRNILIPIDVYKKLEIVYSGDKKYFNTCIWILLFRYQVLGSNNNQLGVLPRVLNKLNKDFNIDFELFGSSINYTLNGYCSVYYDIEKYFGSSGNFFSFEIKEGSYSFNPPYQIDVIEKGVKRLISYLDQNMENNSKLNLTFLITIPIWDNKGKKIMNYRYPDKKTGKEIDYGEFEIINEITNSKYCKAKLMISKKNFTYLDHNFKLYKNNTIQNTYVFVLSNRNNDFQSVLNHYDFS